MGITIHYRGRLADLSQVEPLEDLVIDLVLATGGTVEVWRSASDDDPARVVRGLIVNIEPGQETLSLLFSPEGWLTPLVDIEAAELGTMDDAPWCFVKTQYGTPVGHAALAELLTIVRDRFLPALEVEDEAGYWNHRDPRRLAEAMENNARAIEALASAVEETSLTEEARQSPEIVAARIERIARIVHQSFESPAAPPADAGESGSDIGRPWRDVETEWQSLVRQNEARARRIKRTVNERLLAGDEPEEAFEAAMRAEGLPDRPPDVAREQDPDEPFYEADQVADEPWQTEEDEGELLAEPGGRDPLLERATQLYKRLIDLAGRSTSPQVGDLLRHAGDVCGGLAQALPLPAPYEFDPDERGLTAAQLKRALRGAAYLRGVLINLAYAAADAGAEFDRLREEVETIQREIVDCLQRSRPAPDI